MEKRRAKRTVACFQTISGAIAVLTIIAVILCVFSFGKYLLQRDAVLRRDAVGIVASYPKSSALFKDSRWENVAKIGYLNIVLLPPVLDKKLEKHVLDILSILNTNAEHFLINKFEYIAITSGETPVVLIYNIAILSDRTIADRVMLIDYVRVLQFIENVNQGPVGSLLYFSDFD